MHQRDTLFTNGIWVAPSGQGKIEVIEASIEQVMESVREGDSDDANGAVAAARAAFEAWSATAALKRAEFLEYKSSQCRPLR